MAVVPEVQRVQTPPPALNQQVAQPLPASKAIFTQIKEKAIWAKNSSIQTLKTASEAMKRLFARVVEAVRNFFAPKLEAAKKTLQKMSDNISLKLGARSYTPQINQLKEKTVQLENRLRLATQERENILQINQILAQENQQMRLAQPELAAALPPPPQIQPVQELLPPPPVQPAAQVQKKTGIFKIFDGWW